MGSGGRDEPARVFTQAVAVAIKSEIFVLSGDIGFARFNAEILARPTARNTAIDRYVDESTFNSLPYEGFDWRNYSLRPAPAFWLLKDGDEIDLGNRKFLVMHLPGHSPGCISLYERDSETLFAGDVIYDGTLYDDLEGSSVENYRQSLRKLRDLPVEIVHGGHRESFGRRRMIEIIDAYLQRTAPSPTTAASQPAPWS